MFKNFESVEEAVLCTIGFIAIGLAFGMLVGAAMFL